jgi:hypothetical protein
MNCRCLFLRRRFVLYLEGGISPRQAERLEKHLADCRDCGELFTRLRAGHQAGRQFGRVGPEIGQRPPEFEELRADIGATLNRRGMPVRTKGNILHALTTPLAVRALTALVLALSVLLVVSNRKTLWRADDGAAILSNARELRDFTPLRITEFASNTKSPVVTEGFVRDVYFDKQEKTLHIKLVDVQQKAEPFVICEILSPGGIAIPREGSRVRVYGMARYDSQPGRGWHEVNPVMSIDVLKR